jgi:excisionase family DNA binding protein
VGGGERPDHHLPDRGLGWTLPVFVACCRGCGTELARHTNQRAAERTARRTRRPDCGTRTTSLASDLELASGRRALAAPPAARPPPRPSAPTRRKEVNRMPTRAWLRAAEVAARLHVSPKTVACWAKDGRLPYRRTLGGHRRYDPDQIDQLLRALTYRP